MKKLLSAVFACAALCALQAYENSPAANGAGGDLNRQIAELQSRLDEADAKLEKSMATIVSLRAENRLLKSRLKEAQSMAAAEDSDSEGKAAAPAAAAPQNKDFPDADLFKEKKSGSVSEMILESESKKIEPKTEEERKLEAEQNAELNRRQRLAIEAQENAARDSGASTSGYPF